MKKVTKSDLGVSYANFPEEHRVFMEKNADIIVDCVNKALDGLLSKDEVETKFKSVNESIAGFDKEKFAAVIKENEDLCKQVKNLGESIEKLKKAGISMQLINKFDEKLNEMLDSERFCEFAEGQSRKSGKFDGFKLKDIVSMTDNYQGEHLTTQQLRNVVSQVANKKMHIRDVVTTLTGDAEYPNLAFQQVYDFDRNARYVTENGQLPESSISVKEVQTSTKRLGTHINISKRMLKSRVYLRSYILNMLPEAVYMAEDWNMIFGNGNGENLLGIVNHTGVESIESILSTAIVEGAAGSIASIESVAGGVVVTFSNPQSLVLDGTTIKFAGATTNSNLNASFPVIKMNDRQILLHGVTIASAEASVAAMTFKVTNGAYKSIESPNSGDAVKTAFAVMSFAQFSSNAIVLNPLTVNAIDSEKDTTGRSLDIVKVGANGVKMIAGYPVIEYSGMPMGKYLIGDFAQACALVDYTNLNLEWAEDVNTNLTNTIELIAQEEVIFPVYMPWAFSYGDLAALITAITKD